MRPVFTVAVEGQTDAAVARRLLSWAGADIGDIHGGLGKDHLDRRIRGYNQAARAVPWLVLRDLDRDAPCAGALVDSLLVARAPWMCLRIAVRQVEAWLLADTQRMAAFLGIAEALVPPSPESLTDAKAKLVRLASHAPSRDLREDMVPRAGTTARVGPGYAARVQEFADSHWRPSVAARSSPSLDRCVRAVRRMIGRVQGNR